MGKKLQQSSQPSSHKPRFADSKRPTPGVGTYEPRKEAVLKQSPRVARRNEDRFKWLGASLTSAVPLVYETDIMTSLKPRGV